MREETSELQKFKDRNPSWGEIFGALATKAKPYAIGAVLGAGGLVAAVVASAPAPSDAAPVVLAQAEKSPLAQAMTPPVLEPGYQTPLSLSQETSPVLAEQPDRPGSHTPKKLDIDLDNIPEAEVFEINAKTMALADVIDDRATSELDAINVIRKALETGDAFADPTVSGEKKADVIRQALELAKQSGNTSAFEYDNHVFKIAHSLPKTAVLNEAVETLNWKRDQVRSSISATEGMIAGYASGDMEKVMDNLVELTELMENYEFATAPEKMIEALTDELESKTDQPAPNEDAGSLAPKFRDVSAPIGKLNGHFENRGPSSAYSI